QYAIGWITPDRIEPRWLVEGAAEYVGFRVAIVGRGLQSATETQGCQQFSVDHAPVGTTPLSMLEELAFYEAGNQGAYSVGSLAAEQAVQGRGIGSLLTFGVTVAAAPSLWRDAFQTAFGTPLTTFYDAFEQYRRSWHSPSSYTCTY